MQQRTIHSEFSVGDMLARYVLEPTDGRMGLLLIPASMKSQLADRRQTISDEPEIAALPGPPQISASRLAPLAQVKIIGDPYPGAFAAGRTMLYAPSNDRFRFDSQTHQISGDLHTVRTTLKADDGCIIEHDLSWHDGDVAISVATKFVNSSPHPVTLELLTSFSLAGITPFDAADASEQLRVHRFRSVWSAEGRLDTQTIEQLHLERSWSGSGTFSERYGQVGSMPVRGWFPFVAIEDIPRNVIWGAQLSWAGSWQMEISRQHDEVDLSGGQADREFGHWQKTLTPGESLQSPPATLTCVAGDFDLLCDRLTAVQQRAAETAPKIEHDLPIVFNEWCTTWGDPSHERLMAIANRLRGTDTRYLVIDAGWYKTEKGDWGDGHGDWIPSRKLFPGGLEATAKAIAATGLVPGLWFEMETVGSASAAFSLVDLLLKRDGIPLTTRSRRFWNLNNSDAVEYLSDRVIDLLDRCQFGYLKVDYNETIGLGADGESLGEGLREQIEGVYRFFDRIRVCLPNLVIENCSSGGHRLEPSMLGRTAMSSFSDAHELVEIPIIAANLHRLMLPRQSQIWAVLHPADSDRRLVYSLAATFLGRMCISGEIDRLDERQWKIVLASQALYRKAAPIIKYGISRKFGEMNSSWRRPRGWQGVLRISADDRSALAVVHTFAGGSTNPTIDLPPGVWVIAGQFAVEPMIASIQENSLRLKLQSDFDSAVVILKQQGI